MMPSLRSLAPFFALAPLLSRAFEQCWYPDGSTLAPDIPCNDNGSASACCNEDAFCLENGLCLSAGLVSRGSCTDSTWSSPNCAQYCTQASPSTGMGLLPCDGFATTWDCMEGSNICGNNADTFSIKNADAIVLRASMVANLQSEPSEVMVVSPTSVLQVTSNGNGGSGTTHTVTVTPSSSNDAMFTAGQMAGVGAGVGIPLLLALIGAIIVIMRQRKQLHPPNSLSLAGHGPLVHYQQQAGPLLHCEQQVAPKYGDSSGYQGHLLQVSEMSGNGLQELPGNR